MSKENVPSENLRKDLELVNSKIRALEKSKSDLAEETGRTLGENAAVREKLDEWGEFSAAFSRLDASVREREGLDKKRDELAWIVTEKKQLEEARKDLKSSIKELEKNNQSYYEAMGRAGYQAYREGLLQGPNYDDIFAGLVAQREKINTFEVELKKTGEEQGKKGFFERIANRGKEVYLKGNQSLGLRGLVKVYQKAGETLGNMDGAGSVPPELESMTDQEPLKVAFIPFLKNQERLDVLCRDDQALESKEADLNQKLEDSQVSAKNLPRALQELEQQYKSLGESLLKTYRELGELWWGLDKKKRKPLEVADGLERKWEEIQKEELRINKEKEILNQKLLLKNLEQKRSYHQGEITRLEGRITKTQGELDSEKAELEKLNREYEDLRTNLEVLQENV